MSQEQYEFPAFGKIIRESWQLAQSKILSILAAAAVIILPYTITVLLSIWAVESGIVYIWILVALTMLCSFYASLKAGLALTQILYISNPHEKSSLKDYWKKTSIKKIIIPLLLTGLITYLMKSGGNVLFIIPGIIIGLATMYSATLVTVGKTIKVSQAIAISNGLTFGYKSEIFTTYILTGIITAALLFGSILLSEISLGVAIILGTIILVAALLLLVTIPATIYRHLINREFRPRPYKLWHIIVLIILAPIYITLSFLMNMESLNEKIQDHSNIEFPTETNIETDTQVQG